VPIKWTQWKKNKTGEKIQLREELRRQALALAYGCHALQMRLFIYKEEVVRYVFLWVDLYSNPLFFMHFLELYVEHFSLLAWRVFSPS
jgi:hypothetical protein